MSDMSTVLIGKKPAMNYVLACLTVIQNGSNSVTLKARGRAISKAVDVAQILTRRFATDVGVKNIAINTEQVKSIETGAMSNVSSIEIILER
ncbi:MAG: DNA-binding protein Alba [Thaumarchaeota archaeon]|nr:DNA-binding protein Alba [Nitrososphaerota archaeon]